MEKEKKRDSKQEKEVERDTHGESERQLGQEMWVHLVL